MHRYVVDDKLGAGGMGVVYGAIDPELDRRVALKLVQPRGSQAANERQRTRLLREAQAMARLSHPNVVTVFDVGTHGNQVFIAMELVTGQTLGKWVASSPRSWREVRDVMLRAGRGLAAAHASGLVHRDFKPDNVMVATDGRVLVMDFGLARESSESAADDDGDLEVVAEAKRVDPALTRPGKRVGTPRYMAPEQHFFGETDARTDQFSYCITLYEAIYGEYPFPHTSLDDLTLAVSGGRLRAAPRNTTVPGWLREVILRGLKVDPEARWPSMDALLDALASDRRRARIAVSLAGLVLIGGTIALSASSGAPDRCAGVESALGEVWDDAARERLATAFEKSEVVYAPETFRRASSRLDAYAQEWTRARQEACRAAPEIDPVLADLTGACLQARLHDLRVAVMLLGRADVGAVEHAVDVASDLPAVATCFDEAWLRADAPLPPEPEVARQVSEARDRLKRAETLRLVGRSAESTEQQELAARLADASGYVPVIADAAAALGDRLLQTGDVERGRASCEHALASATSVGTDRAQMLASACLAHAAGMYDQDAATSERHLRHARAVLQRLGEPGDLVVELELRAGGVHLQLQDLASAERELRRAIVAASDHPNLQRHRIAALSNLGNTLASQGRYEEALSIQREAFALATARHGELHPVVAHIEGNLGVTMLQQGHGEAAVAQLRDALRHHEQVFSDAPAAVALVEVNLGVALARTGQQEEALEHYLRALEVRRETLGPDSPAVASVSNDIADTLIQLGRAQEAVAYAKEALRIWRDEAASENVNSHMGLLTLADARFALGDARGAAELAREGVQLAEARGVEPLSRARFRFSAAIICWAAGLREEALEHARAARDGFVAAGEPAATDRLGLAEWLDAQAIAIE